MSPMRKSSSDASLVEASSQHDLVTLSNFILRKARAEESADLAILLSSIATACKYLSNTVRKAGLANLSGSAGEVNVQGEEQQKLDVLAHEVFVNSLNASKRCTVLVSEEHPDPIVCTNSDRGAYVAVFDPLDGSSNIDCGVSIGTIFGIFRAGETGVVNEQDTLKPGTEMLLAGYCLYGSSTIFVVTIGSGVHGFTLDPSIGEFVLTHPNITVPKRGSIYSVNEGNASIWNPAMAAYVEKVKHPKEPDVKPQSMRYVGSMVADVHRTLLYGGTFSYPADKKNKKGKLRLLYECFPMACIMELAGGAASTGKGRVLEVRPESIHERCPIHLGSTEDVAAIEEVYRQLEP